MTITNSGSITGVIEATAAAVGGSASAEDDSPLSWEEAKSPAPALAGFDGMQVSAAKLDEKRGGEKMNDMQLDGVVGGNHASDLVTGSNFVADGSLTGNAGFTTVVQNTGNNVLIQNATIVNLQLQ